MFFLCARRVFCRSLREDAVFERGFSVKNGEAKKSYLGRGLAGNYRESKNFTNHTIPLLRCMNEGFPKAPLPKLGSGAFGAAAVCEAGKPSPRSVTHQAAMFSTANTGVSAELPGYTASQLKYRSYTPYGTARQNESCVKSWTCTRPGD